MTKNLGRFYDWKNFSNTIQTIQIKKKTKQRSQNFKNYHEMLQLQTSSATRGNGDRLRLGMNSQTRQTPTKTESNSSDRHSNQALHLHQLAISYTHADIGDPVINRQNMGGSISVQLTTCGFVMKSNCYSEKICMLKNSGMLKNYGLLIFLFSCYWWIVLQKNHRFDCHCFY